MAILVKLFTDRQCVVSHAVLHYLVCRMERKFSTARELVEQIDQMSLAGKKPITVSLVKTVFEAQNALGEYSPNHRDE